MVFPNNWSEIATHEQFIGRISGTTNESKNTIISILTINPLKPIRCEVTLIERWFFAIKPIQISNQILHSLM